MGHSVVPPGKLGAIAKRRSDPDLPDPCLVEKSQPPSPRNHQDSPFRSDSVNLPESARGWLGILHSDIDLREQGKLERQEPRSRIVENVVSPRHPWKSWKSHTD